MKSWFFLLFGSICLFTPFGDPIRAQDRLVISEFMARNDRGLEDEDRDEEDWIEIHNSGPDTANLAGWYLTDDRTNLTQWRFPDVLLSPEAYLIVFASGKDRRDPASALHTNFKLKASGEYLGLIRPDGLTVVSEFNPYPLQAADTSYGLIGQEVELNLLPPGSMAKALIPNSSAWEPSRRSRDTQRPWTLEDWDDSTWQLGTTGIGYDYPGLIGLDVSAMRNRNQTVYTRIPFEVDDPAAVEALTLRMRFDDGFIAYINGQEVARSNAPDAPIGTWNSGAVADRPDNLALEPMDFPIPKFDFLHVGTNLLAVQGLNHLTGSSDLLVLPELVASVPDVTGDSLRYFPIPTPGKANNTGVADLGPIITEMDHFPPVPHEGNDVFVTARIGTAFDPVDTATLFYRVMFEHETRVPLLDDGRNGDGTAGDGLYGARIPAHLLHRGQMLRWYMTATDVVGRRSRYPAFSDPLKSPQYDGTVVTDPRLTNPLPVLHWFIQNPSGANSDAGTRCSLYYEGEFYDNLLINIHGQSSRDFPKKSYDIDFHPGHNFKWAPDAPRADDINLMTTYPDKAQMRNMLAYRTYRDVGCAYHWVFPVRVQQNGRFWGTAHVMENGDEDWLIRMGLNADGALYKMYNAFSNVGHTTSGAEKKTRKYESNDDLRDLYHGVRLSGEARRRYLYDNVDMAQVVNSLAARILTGDKDCCHKNYYLYRDTGRSNEWQLWPWDVDLSFGRRWISSHTYWDERLIPDTPLFVGDNNGFVQAFFNTSEIRQMYLRRIRTLMDEYLKEPGTPSEGFYYEPIIDLWTAMIAPDAALDARKWNSHAWGQGSTWPCCPQSQPEAADEIKHVYLPERRIQLYGGLAYGARELPEAQPSNTVLQFGRIETDPVRSNLGGEYIQVINPQPYAVDLSHWRLVGDIDFIFQGGTVIPAWGDLYVAADRVAFRRRRSSPTGGQALFVVGDYSGRLSSAGFLVIKDRQGQIVARVDNIIDHSPGKYSASR